SLFATDQNPGDAAVAYGAALPVEVAGRRWMLRLTATNVFVALRVDRSPLWVLDGGLIVALLVSGLVYQSLRARVRQDRQSRHHMLALEKLTQIATAISGRIQFPREVLDQLANAAGELLAMDRSGISLL